MIQSYKFIAVRVQWQLYSPLSRNTLVFWFFATSSLSYDLLEKPVLAGESKLCFYLVWTLVTNMWFQLHVRFSAALRKGMGQGLRPVLLQTLQNALSFYPKLNMNWNWISYHSYLQPIWFNNICISETTQSFMLTKIHLQMQPSHYAFLETNNQCPCRP